MKRIFSSSFAFGLFKRSRPIPDILQNLLYGPLQGIFIASIPACGLNVALLVFIV